MEKLIIEDICRELRWNEKIVIKIFAKIFIKVYHIGRINCLQSRLRKWLYQTEYGGPDGELAASLRYLSQWFGMPDQKAKAILNDIGTEELAHLEIVGTIVHQLTEGCSAEDMKNAGVGAYYTDHGLGVYPQAAAGWPYNAATIAVKGDPIADLQEDLAAEQQTRATYEKLIDLCADEKDVIDVLRFLREREVVHFQRFGEALRGVQDKLAEKKFYMNNMNCMKNDMR